MKGGLKLLLIFFIPVFSSVPVHAQYILNGNATIESCNCYVLTQPYEFQGGSVWQQTKIDLRLPFDFSFNVYLGSLDDKGADGIVFMLQPLSTSLGSTGNGMGFAGVKPSIGVLIDTWQNTEDNDPSYDHISIQANGVIGHGTDLSGPVPSTALANGGNIEDGKWHILRIKWDPASFTLKTWVDGDERVSAVKNLVTEIFNNDPLVYWGFSAATGGSVNLQKFCTALNPGFQTNADSQNDAVCLGVPVQFSDRSVSFTSIKSYHWDFGDGNVSTDANPPPHIYSQPGNYEVKHYIIAADGCESPPNLKTVSVGDYPVLSMNIFDTCESDIPRLNVTNTLKIGVVDHWQWNLDGLPFSNSELPDFSKLLPGNHLLQLTTTSNIGCVSNPVTDQFIIKNKPAIDFNFAGNCLNEATIFSAFQTNNFPGVHQWQWNFGDGNFSLQKDTQFVFSAPGKYPVKVEAIGDNGCESSVEKELMIIEARADAGRDTIVLPGTPFQLNGSGGSVYAWSPANGLSNAFIANPTGSINDDITYYLTVRTVEGCEDTASVNLTVFKGSAVYVPTAFTPNNDGLNDVLKPYFIGIKTLSFFTIYDRWGGKVYSTKDMNKGWDGYAKGRVFDTGSYVWVLRAVDQIGKVYNLKGTFTLLK